MVWGQIASAALGAGLDYLSKKKSKAQPAMSGFGAMTPQQQQAWNQFLTQAQQFGNAGLSQYEQNAINELGQPGYGNYQDYMNPYLQQVQAQVLNDIEQQGAKNQNQLLSRLGQGRNLTAFSSSATGQQLGENQSNTANSRARAIAQLQNQGFQQAIQGRQKGIYNQLLAGQYPGERVKQYGQLLQQLPGSQTAGTLAQPTNTAKFAGLAQNFLGNPAIQNAFSNYFDLNNQYGPPTMQQLYGGYYGGF